MILITFMFFFQAFSTTLEKLLTALLRLAMSDRLELLMFLMDVVRSLINVNSSLLSLMIEHLLELICSSTMGIVIVRGT